MKIKAGSISLVVAGAWNPYILTPEWVLRRTHGIGPGENRPVSTTIGFGIKQEDPKFAFPGLYTYQVRREAFLLAPETNTEEAMTIVEKTMRTILETVKHTPVTALGYNFEFVADDSTPSLEQIRIAQADVVEAADDEFSVVSNSIRTSMQKNELLLNIEKLFQEGALSLKFNFHMPATNTAAVVAQIDSRSMWRSFEEATDIARQILGEGLTND